MKKLEYVATDVYEAGFLSLEDCPVEVLKINEDNVFSFENTEQLPYAIAAYNKGAKVIAKNMRLTSNCLILRHPRSSGIR